MQYKPGDIAHICATYTVDGVPQTGQALKVTIYNRATQAKTVDAASLSEVGATGAYYYDYTTPGSDANYDVLIYRGSQLLKVLDLIVSASAQGEYVPGDTIRFVAAIVVDGEAQTGLSPVIDIYNMVTHAATVSDGAMTEIGTTGVYYYDLVSGATEITYFALIFNGSDLVTTRTTNTISTTSGPTLTSRFTSLTTMNARVDATLGGFSVYGQTSAEVDLWINQAIEAILRRYGPLMDDFFYNVFGGNYDYQVDSTIPYPDNIREVYYDDGNGKVQLTATSRSVVEADLAAGNSSVYRYAVVRDTYKYRIFLNAEPADNYPSGLIIVGNYFPAYVSGTDLLPLEKRIDRAVEAIAASMGVNQYIENPAIKKVVSDWAEFELAQLGLPNGGL